MDQSKQNVKSVIIAIAVFIAGALCQIPSMVKSGFLNAFNAEISLSFIALMTFICIVYRIFRTDSSAYTASFVGVLLFADWSQLMLFYTCNRDSDMIRNNVIEFMLYTVAAIAAAWVLFQILDRIRHARTGCLIAFSVFALGVSAFIFLFSGENNTSTVAGGFQPAIIMMFLMLYAFANAAAGNHDFFQKCAYLSLFWIMTGALALKHEFGIPVMCYAACLLMYFFFNKSKKEPWFIMTNLLIPVLGLILIMLLSPSLRNDTLGKLTVRTGENEQWLVAKANLKASSLFGSEKYDIFLSQASSDYSLNTDVHYWGFIWVAVMMFSFFMMTVSLYRDMLQNSNDNVISNMKKLAFSGIVIITVYNLLDNICGFPVIGVQSLCCGTSKSIAILSGLLIGSVMADPMRMEFSIWEFLKKTKLITESV